MLEDSTIYVAGSHGLVGSAICRALRQAGFINLIERSHAELDLCNQSAVERFFIAEHPEYVFLAAARVGGINANSSFPADFIRDNLQIQTNVIDAAWRHAARKLVFLGSSCIYPKLAEQPMREDMLLTGALEQTNEWYAIAKIAGLKMCQAYRRQYGFDAISLMPTNLYGPGDNFHPENSHVLPALIQRFHHAKINALPSVTIWGSGRPRREFLHVDDLARAALMLMEHYSADSPINVGTGEDLPIIELAQLIAAVVGYQGQILTDPSRPDGTPRKLLDVSRLKAMGWQPSISLRDGVCETYEWYRHHCAKAA
ncbi:MAG: GDP-L-fucose synthase family protein [Steroidobacteraceae bacterium]